MSSNMPHAVPKSARRNKSTAAPDYFQASMTFIGLAVCLAIFLAVERLITPIYDFGTSLDASIPLIPWSYVIYVSFFPFVVVLSAYTPRDRFKTFMLAAGLSFIGAMVCFFLFPETLPRPDLSVIENEFLRQRFTHMWTVDLACNGFPSLHVVVTCLACHIMANAGCRRIAWTFGVLVIISTLTVKQHTLADVAGGVLLASMACILAEKLLSSPRVSAQPNVLIE